MLQNNGEGGNNKKSSSSLFELLTLVASDSASCWQRKKTSARKDIWEVVFFRLTPRNHRGSAGVSRLRYSEACCPRSPCPPCRSSVWGSPRSRWIRGWSEGLVFAFKSPGFDKYRVNTPAGLSLRASLNEELFADTSGHWLRKIKTV